MNQQFQQQIPSQFQHLPPQSSMSYMQPVAPSSAPILNQQQQLHASQRNSPMMASNVPAPTVVPKSSSSSNRNKISSNSNKKPSKSSNVSNANNNNHSIAVNTKSGKNEFSSGASTGSGGATARDAHLTPEERAKQNRDRNREHARSTRLRKKAYVQKLKELVEGLHAERTEEVRQRRIAIQQLSEVQNVRRNVIRTFLRYHSQYEGDERKWSTLLEENFWLKQPVTPYRSFCRSEMGKVRQGRGMVVHYFSNYLDFVFLTFSNIALTSV